MKLTHLALWMAAVTLCLPIGGVCQEDPAEAEIDRTDPAAVARAYVQACRTGDAQTAFALVHERDPLRLAISGMAGDMTRREMERPGFDFTRILTEMMFVPVEFGFDAAEPVLEQDADGRTVVSSKRSWAVDQELVMVQAEDGTWSIKASESIPATTGSEASFLVTQIAGGPGSPGPVMGVYESQQRLLRLAGAFEQYAREHDGLLPPAATWCDAIDVYVLDPELFESPAFPEQAYGYAMNVLADELELPQNWQDRRNLILLFEWRGAERNATATPEETADMESGWPDGTIVMVDASRNTHRVPAGMALEDMAEAQEARNTCENRVRMLAKAARAFARDNDGLLPGPGTWQDDIALYLLDEAGGDDVFRCPAAPDLDFAYAINSAIAGMDATEIRGHGDVILFFESDLNVPNAAGDPDVDVPSPGRHTIGWGAGLRNSAAYLSGWTTHLQPPDPAGQ